MAKKRDKLSPLDSMQGADETSTLARQMKMLGNKARSSGIDVNKLLAESFGVQAPNAERKLVAKDGTEYTFYEVELAPGELEDKTYVVESINGREQSLTADQCADLDSIKDHQYYHAFGVFDTEGKINILDGSRRRFKYLLCEPSYKFRVWVTEQNLTAQQAKWFARDMQSAKPKTYRDEGLRLQELQKEVPEATYAELGAIYSERMGQDVVWNKKAVQRRLNAAALPRELIQYFSLGLSARNFDELHLLFTKDYNNSIDDMEVIIKDLPKRDSSEDEVDYNRRLIKALKDASATKPKQPKSTDELIAGFNNRKRRANKTVKPNGVISFEFKGLEDSDIEEVESFIRSLLQKESD